MDIKVLLTLFLAARAVGGVDLRWNRFTLINPKPSRPLPAAFVDFTDGSFKNGRSYKACWWAGLGVTGP